MCIKQYVNRYLCICISEIKDILDPIYEDCPRIIQFTDFTKTNS